MRKRILVTAGPTHEAIDPVRYIANHSTGKMGYAIALEFANRGYEVALISGPTDITIQHSLIKLIRVTSAQDMYEACLKVFDTVQGVVLSAAVADFTPVYSSSTKIKKTGNSEFVLNLKPTKDIAKELGKIKGDKVLVGFALETDNELSNAKKKLISKNFDFIVLNSLQEKGAGFAFDTNKITIIDKYNNIYNFELKDKALVALDIVNEFEKLL